MAPRRVKLGEDGLSSVKMGIRWFKIDKISDKMRLDEGCLERFRLPGGGCVRWHPQ